MNTVVTALLAPPVGVATGGDPSASRTVYAAVVLLVLIGIALLVVAVWLFRGTRVDRELLAPLETMSDRKWRRLDPASQRRLLDEQRPEGARPLRRTPAVPVLDTEFEEGAPAAAGFDDLSTDPDEAGGGDGAADGDPSEYDDTEPSSRPFGELDDELSAGLEDVVGGDGVASEADGEHPAPDDTVGDSAEHGPEGTADGEAPEDAIVEGTTDGEAPEDAVADAAEYEPEGTADGEAPDGAVVEGTADGDAPAEAAEVDASDEGDAVPDEGPDPSANGSADLADAVPAEPVEPGTSPDDADAVAVSPSGEDAPTASGAGPVDQSPPNPATVER